MAPLYSVLAGKPKDLTWGPLQEDAFQKAKDALASSTLLVFPNPKNPLIVTTDASNIAIAIAEFNCTLTHLPGKKNPVADALSRIEINAVQLGLDYNQLAKEQQQDPETTAVRTAITALQWKDVPLGDSNISILCNVSTGRPRPWIPSSLRRHVFNLIHGLSHPSRRATTQLLTQKFIWHKISRDAGNWLHPSSSSTTITLPKQSTGTQGQLAYEERDAQLDSPVTPRHTNGKKRCRSTTIPPSSITTTESVPTRTVSGPSTSRHSSTPRSHPRQCNLTPSKIIPLLFMEDGGSESDVIGSDEVWLGNNALSSSSDEDEGNENDGTSVNLHEVFSFDWSEGSDFVPDQHDNRPNRSGTTRDWPCNDEARESTFFRAFIDEEVMSYIAEKTNRYNNRTGPTEMAVDSSP
ncbi:hypothetical protein Pcinc_003064 [Petrolisthes cinctipes]|uniref:RNA-directed DNA polymerase n=1 Tax=Petrolisthes cinctipes TaxID=88211 RepID=A0AAE1GJL3_PETCI|nr:hypothetical protein Pcinc_003064 [Petrolisthes cinctipes]